MEDNNLEILLKKINQEITDDSSNHFIDLDNSIFTDLISKIENLIFICPECSDSPRITP